MRANDAALEMSVTHIDVLATSSPVDEKPLALGRSTAAALEVGGDSVSSTQVDLFAWQQQGRRQSIVKVPAPARAAGCTRKGSPTRGNMLDQFCPQ